MLEKPSLNGPALDNGRIKPCRPQIECLMERPYLKRQAPSDIPSVYVIMHDEAYITLISIHPMSDIELLPFRIP